MKSFGAGNIDRSLNLVYAISRISTLIMLVIVIPLCLCMDDILVFWLKTPPKYTSIFAVFMLIKGINALRRPAPEPEPEVTTKICPFCHSEIHIEATKCPFCASEQPEHAE